MALTATMHHVELTISDVERSVYETLELRVARHPSESARYLLTRILAYALEHAEGIAFSKGGLSSVEEPPLSVHDATGLLLAWIEIGAPSADRLHKATKAAKSVAIYTHTDMAHLRREADTRKIHRVETIQVWRFEPAYLDLLAESLDRRTAVEVVRSDGRLYVTIAGNLHEAELSPQQLAIV